MSNDNKLFYDKWSTQVQSGHQTKNSIYTGLTDVMGMQSDKFFWNILGTVAMAPVNNEDSEHAHQARDQEERQMRSSPAYLALKFQKGELLRSPVDVKARWTQHSIFAMNRWNDNVVRAAATGDAIAQYEGETVPVVKTLAAFVGGNPAASGSQVIAVGGTGMTEVKVKEIRSTFVKNKALQGGEKIYCSISQNEEDTIIGVDNWHASSDNLRFVQEGAIATGKIAGELYGVTFVRDEDLAVSGTTRTCFAWVKSGIRFGNQTGVMTRQDEIQTRHYMDQFYLRVDNGATRTRESEVMIINTVTTA